MVPLTAVEYARHSGLTSFTPAKNLNSLLECFVRDEKMTDFSALHLQNSADILTVVNRSHSDLASELFENDEVETSQSTVRFLEQCTARPEIDLLKVWNQYKPDLASLSSRPRRAKAEVPLSQTWISNVSRDTWRLRRDLSSTIMLADVEAEWQAHAAAWERVKDADKETWTRELEEHTNALEQELGSEKLSVSKEALNLLKACMACRFDKSSVEECIQNKMPTRQTLFLSKTSVTSNLDESFNTEFGYTEADGLTDQTGRVEALERRIRTNKTLKRQHPSTVDTSACTESTSDGENQANKRQKMPDQTEGDTNMQDLFEDRVLTDKSKLQKMKLPGVAVARYRPVFPSLNASAVLHEVMRSSALDQKSRQDSNLNWQPFPTPDWMDVLNEMVQYDRQYLYETLRRPDKVVNSADLIWKQPGLRLLDLLDTVDEKLAHDNEIFDKLDDGNFKRDPGAPHVPAKSPDTFQMPKSRKMVFPSVKSTLMLEISRSPIKRASSFKISPEVEDPILASQEPSFTTTRNSTGLLPMQINKPEEPPSHDLLGSHSVLSFLRLRGKPAPHQGSLFDAALKELESDPIQTSQVIYKPGPKESGFLSEVESGFTAKSRECATSPISQIEKICEPRAIVLDDSLLQTRPSLIRFLEIEGDKRLMMVYRSLSNECENGPDIILRPKICIIVSNLQALFQRPLPGQNRPGVLSPLHKRTAELASRFESVFVLIQHDNLKVDNEPNGYSQAMTRFAGFCASLGQGDTCSFVKSIYVSGQSEGKSSALRSLNAWTWDLVRKYSLSAPRIQMGGEIELQDLLKHDESLWELFLRRSGMNPLASQVILGALGTRGRTVVSVSDQGHVEGGLAEFVKMDPQRRRELFAEIIGEEELGRIDRLFSAEFD